MFQVEDLDSKFERVGIKGIRLKPEKPAGGSKKRKKKGVKSAAQTFRAAASAVASASTISKEAQLHAEGRRQEEAEAEASRQKAGNGSSAGGRPGGKPKFGLSPEDMGGSTDDSDDEIEDDDDLESVGSDSSDDDEDEVLDEDWLAGGTGEDGKEDELGDADGGIGSAGAGSEGKETEADEEEDDGVDWSDLETLRSVLLRAQLSADNRREFVHALERQSFRPGDYIVHQGDKGDSFYIITEGEVVVSKTLESAEDEASFSAVGLVIDGFDSSGRRTREGVLTRLY